LRLNVFRRLKTNIFFLNYVFNKMVQSYRVCMYWRNFYTEQSNLKKPVTTKKIGQTKMCFTCTPTTPQKLAEEKRNWEPTNLMGSRQQQDERTQKINFMVNRNVKVPKTAKSGPVHDHDRIYQSNTSSHHSKGNNSCMWYV
jgi:hypothetical protein